MKDKRTIFLIIGIVIVIALAITYFITGKNNNKDSIKFKEEYEELNGTIREKDGKEIRSVTIPENNPMIYSDEDEIVDMINNKETFVVYFGFEDCPWCRSVIPNLIASANDLGLEKIYYVNVKEIRDTIEYKDGELTTTQKGTSGYYKLLKLLDNVLDDYTITDEDDNEIQANEKRIYAPNVVAVVKGKAKKMTDGISKDQTDGYMKLTKSMNKESYEAFKCIIDCILDKPQVCSKEKAC